MNDIRSWLDAGHTYQMLLDLTNESNALAPVEPGEQTHITSDTDVDTFAEKQLCEDLQIEVMGELEDGGIKAFSMYHRKGIYISDTGRLTFDKLMQMCGPPAKAKLHSSNEQIEGMYTVGEVKQAVALLAGYQRLTTANECGPGIWGGRNDDGELTGSILGVGAGEAFHWNGGEELSRILVPRSDNLILDLASSDPWYHHNTIEEYMLLSAEISWCKEVVEELIEIFSMFNWKKPEQSSHIMAGLIISQWVQTIWRFRPNVGICGPTDCGKTVLLDQMLCPIFGELAMPSSKSTVAGIRQMLDNAAAMVFLDEFEKSPNRQELLDFLRTARSGSNTYRGSPTGLAKVYGLKHMVWIMGIELGLIDAADRNRYIVLEIKKLTKEKRAGFKEIEYSKLHELGQKTLAIAVRHILSARPLAEKLAKEDVEGIDRRVVDLHSVPTAMLSCLMGLDYERSVGLLTHMLGGVDVDTQGSDDEEGLMQDIFGGEVDCGHGIKMSPAAILASDANMLTHSSALEYSGIRRMIRDNTEMIFLDTRSILSRILAKSQWRDKTIDIILLRIKGSKRSRQRIDGRNPRGVLIPSEEIENLVGETGQTAIETDSSMF
jgi:hypothetical protein